MGEVPLLTLENILYFGYKGVSPALIGECAKRKIGLYFMDSHGECAARVCGIDSGNVLLRKKQCLLSEDYTESCKLAKNFICGKIFNARSVIERMKRDHPLSIDKNKFMAVSENLKHLIHETRTISDKETLLGIEGNAASLYFSIFDDLILANKSDFNFSKRQRRPPIGRVNALLSFAYTILANDCASALESVGLDARVGFLHSDRPRRDSLALDLMEELRAIYADKFVLTLINNRIIKKSDFNIKENEVTLLNDEGRRLFFNNWQEKKREMITHPFLKEKIAWGLVPYVQALLRVVYAEILKNILHFYGSDLFVSVGYLRCEY